MIINAFEGDFLLKRVDAIVASDTLFLESIGQEKRISDELSAKTDEICSHFKCFFCIVLVHSSGDDDRASSGSFRWFITLNWLNKTSFLKFF